MSAEEAKLQKMQCLLGRFLNSKAKPQNEREERASVDKKQSAVQKRITEEVGTADPLKAVSYSPSAGFSYANTELSEGPCLTRRSDLTGVSSTQKKSSACPVLKRGFLSSNRGSVTRKNFAVLKSVCQEEIFTNHESLPPIDEAYKQFEGLYPEYLRTRKIDKIRAREYLDLDESGHVFLDYSGYGLFSKWQEKWRKTTASFGLSYIPVSLPTHALYGGADEGTVEHDIKQTILEFLNIQESEYTIVFTASRASAFKLLGESYPFHLNKRLLSVYDYESDAIARLEESAQKNGAKIMSARFRWPSQRLWATDLKNKLSEKKRDMREGGKGLFVFPVQSRVTGAKYSYQWISQAQDNGWDILLDASALGPKAMTTLGLCVFRPDFIVSSFFKVYGSDPTGFGCLLIKRSAIQRLHSSSAARGVGMVRLVPTSSFSERLLKDGDVREMEIVMADSTRYTERRQMCSSEGACMAGASYPTSKLVACGSHNEEKSRLSLVSTSMRSSPSSKRHEVVECQATGTISRILENNSTACSLYPARKGHDENSASSSIMLSEQSGRENLNSALRLAACYSSTNDLSQRIGIVQIAVKSSLSHGVRGQDASSSDIRMPSSDPSAHEVSTEPPQKKFDVHSVRVVQVRTGDCFSPSPNAQQVGDLSSSESRSSTSFDSLNRSYDRSIRTSLHPSKPSCACSSSRLHDDRPYAHMEDMPSALFFEDGDSEDAISDSITGEEEEEEKRHQEDNNENVKPSFKEMKKPEIQCRGLYHAHKLGLIGTNIRLRCLTNWLIAAMLKLQHPGTPTSHQLVQVYGPKVDYERGASVAFNLTDWKGDLIQPLLVQRLADRNNISLGVSSLSHTYVPKNSAKWSLHLEHIHANGVSVGNTGEVVSGDKSSRFNVITVALCFLSNFEDVYRFWLFLANFLDADFVSKEVWCYRSLNQATVMLVGEEPGKL